MYFAICDDNIADRKQSERLLKRQAERVLKEAGEQVYIDSFGNKEAFMIRPQMYQALFIDMTLDETNGFAIAKNLLDIGIVKPIILCCSSINYREQKYVVDPKYSDPLAINDDKSLFGYQSACLDKNKAMNEVFGEGNWDYWTTGRLRNTWTRRSEPGFPVHITMPCNTYHLSGFASSGVTSRSR